METKSQNIIELIEHQIAENVKIIKKFATNEKISKYLQYLDDYIQQLKN